MAAIAGLAGEHDPGQMNTASAQAARRAASLRRGRGRGGAATITRVQEGTAAQADIAAASGVPYGVSYAVPADHSAGPGRRDALVR